MICYYGETLFETATAFLQDMANQVSISLGTCWSWIFTVLQYNLYNYRVNLTHKKPMMQADVKAPLQIFGFETKYILHAMYYSREVVFYSWP